MTPPPSFPQSHLTQFKPSNKSRTAYPDDIRPPPPRSPPHRSHTDCKLNYWLKEQWLTAVEHGRDCFRWSHDSHPLAISSRGVRTQHARLTLPLGSMQSWNGLKNVFICEIQFVFPSVVCFRVFVGRCWILCCCLRCWSVFSLWKSEQKNKELALVLWLLSNLCYCDIKKGDCIYSCLEKHSPLLVVFLFWCLMTWNWHELFRDFTVPFTDTVRLPKVRTLQCYLLHRLQLASSIHCEFLLFKLLQLLQAGGSDGVQQSFKSCHRFSVGLRAWRGHSNIFKPLERCFSRLLRVFVLLKSPLSIMSLMY